MYLSFSDANLTTRVVLCDISVSCDPARLPGSPLPRNSVARPQRSVHRTISRPIRATSAESFSGRSDDRPSIAVDAERSTIDRWSNDRQSDRRQRSRSPASRPTSARRPVSVRSACSRRRRRACRGGNSGRCRRGSSSRVPAWERPQVPAWETKNPRAHAAQSGARRAPARQDAAAPSQSARRRLRAAAVSILRLGNDALATA